MADAKKVLILMSDTGGGHRAAAEAIREALLRKYGDAVNFEMVDVFRHYTPFPFKYSPELYPFWIKNGKLMWRVGYSMSNQRRSAQWIMRSMYGAFRRGMRRLLLREHNADVVVCVHPLFSSPAMNVLRKPADRPPFITIVTDLVSTHAFWYDPRVDRILVPTQPAYDAGIKFGIKPEQMRVTGLPVNPRFADGLLSKDDARKKLGWNPDLPAILMIGGGEGMGPLFRIARKVNALGAKCQLVIVAGRNEALRQQLEAQQWNQPVHIYPFVTNMPELMAAADLLITKAGPATISEACIAGLPMILSDAIPGQEDGNVIYITENHAGVYAPSPVKVAQAVKTWLDQGPEFLRAAAESARQLARPDAVWEIVDEIWEQAHKPRIPRPQGRPLALFRFPRRRPAQEQAQRVRINAKRKRGSSTQGDNS
jgi:1,2-diacylglycerol 3-beta-galactosyltransferase